MNIKTVVPQPMPVESRLKLERLNTTRYQETTDRDADGRRDQPTHEQKRHLSKEEFEHCLEQLRQHSGIQQSSLSIRVEEHADHRVVLIVAPDGEVVRRLSESELWMATQDRERSTGRLLDKAG
jgi:uncharacterized FlaG/YvyC family protein